MFENIRELGFGLWLRDQWGGVMWALEWRIGGFMCWSMGGHMVERHPRGIIDQGMCHRCGQMVE